MLGGKKKATTITFWQRNLQSCMQKLLCSNIDNQPKGVVSCTWKKDLVNGVIKSDDWGKHGSYFKTNDEDWIFLIDCINLFPVVDSHYCLAKTYKKYMEPNLNIEKMYDFCKCNYSNNGRSTVKSSFYHYCF